MSSSISSSIISSIIVLPYPKSLKMCKDVLLTSLQVWPFDRKTPGISPRLSPPRTYSIKGKDRNLFQIYLAQISHTKYLSYWMGNVKYLLFLVMNVVLKLCNSDLKCLAEYQSLI